MNKLCTTLLFCLLTNIASANDFLGMWQATKVVMSETYFGEIKYPKYFEITENESGVSGYYRDQYDFECKFLLSELGKL